MRTLENEPRGVGFYVLAAFMLPWYVVFCFCETIAEKRAEEARRKAREQEDQAAAPDGV